MDNQRRDFLSVPGLDVTLLPPGTPINEPDITNAIIFIFAEWSGQSHTGWARLKAAAAAIPCNLPAITVCDIDEPLIQEFMRRAGNQPVTGAGETYWIRNGRVAAMLRAGVPGIIQEDVEEFLGRIAENGDRRQMVW
ncbi:MAG TPA: hypothetical protein VHM90_01480 [Phycisphaerae bacterium]|nr:hypothetical protein [Phycisphaerae bacterium]